MSDLSFLPISELSAGLEKGTFSSVEIAETLLAKIERNKSLNCFITVDRESTIAEAKSADAKRKSGEKTRL